MSSRRVLFANHTSELAGAERSLLDLLQSLNGAVEATVACPPGELADALSARGMAVANIPEASVSFRPHPLHTPRGLGRMARIGLRLRKLAREARAPIVHANTERAGLCAALARPAGGPVVVVHVRVRFPETRLGAASANALALGTDAIIANSSYTAAQFRRTPTSGILEVAHNPIDGSRFDPAAVDPATARSDLGLRADDLVLAVVGYLAPVKRQDDAIRILARVRAHHPRARLLVAGTARFASASARVDNQGYADALRSLAVELGVERDVFFLGEQADVRPVLSAADVLLVPSEQEGFGRVALEGMAMATPVIATSVGGIAEVVRDGVDGMLWAPCDPAGWSAAAGALLADANLRATMGARARARALQHFSPEAHVRQVESVYERVLAWKTRSVR